MGPLSSYEVEQICESCYNQAVEFFSRYDYIDDANKFVLTVEEDFIDWSNPQLNYRINDSQITIVHKWRTKLRNAARIWYAENVAGPRENECRERERREQEERERQEQYEAEARRERARRRQIEAEEERRLKEEERIREEEKQREAVIAQAKRKERNEQNKQKLAEIQAQWEASNKSVVQSQTVLARTTSVCPQCGSSVSPTAKFCTECGRKLIVICANCGTTLTPTSKFCTECGTPLGVSGPQSPSSTAPTPKNSSPGPKEEQAKEEHVKEPTVPKATAKTDKAGSAPTLAEIKEKGGIIVYDDESSEDEELVDKLSDILLPDFFDKEQEEINSFIETFSELGDRDDVEWHDFGVPAFDKKERLFGCWDLYHPSHCKYTIVDDNTLVLIGDGMPFDIIPEDEEEDTEYNYWKLNPDILQLKDKITQVVVTCEGVSARLFKDFTDLKYVLLAENLARIETSGFEGCPIKFLILPPTLESIEKNAFKGAKFEGVFISPLTSDPDEWDFSKDSFVKCKELKFFFMPKRIMDRFEVENFFRGCNSLDTDNVWNLDDIKEQIEAFEGSATVNNVDD